MTNERKLKITITSENSEALEELKNELESLLDETIKVEPIVVPVENAKGEQLVQLLIAFWQTGAVPFIFDMLKEHLPKLFESKAKCTLKRERNGITEIYENLTLQQAEEILKRWADEEQ